MCICEWKETFIGWFASGVTQRPSHANVPRVPFSFLTAAVILLCPIDCYSADLLHCILSFPPRRRALDRILENARSASRSRIPAEPGLRGSACARACVSLYGPASAAPACARLHRAASQSLAAAAAAAAARHTGLLFLPALPARVASAQSPAAVNPVRAGATCMLTPPRRRR